MKSFDSELELRIEWESCDVLTATFVNHSDRLVVLRPICDHELLIFHETDIEASPAIHSFHLTVTITQVDELSPGDQIKKTVSFRENRLFPLAGEWRVWVDYDASFETGSYSGASHVELQLPRGVKLSELRTTSNVLKFELTEEEVYHPPPLNFDIEQFNRATERMRWPWYRRIWYWLLGK